MAAKIIDVKIEQGVCGIEAPVEFEEILEIPIDALTAAAGGVRVCGIVHVDR